MRRFFSSLLWIVMSLLPLVGYAEDIPSVYYTYEQYQKNAQEYCDGTEREWHDRKTLVPIPQYPDLTSDAINRQVQRTRSLSTLTPAERDRLEEGLSDQRMGNFSGYKTVELARLQYRSTMNSLFACAIVESRLALVDTLKKEIEKRLPARTSEIMEQLQKEADRLQSHKDEMRCQSEPPQVGGAERQLINTATRQYCHYRYYLTFLSDRLEHDKHALERTEERVGIGSGTQSASTIAAWQESYFRYASAIERDIMRADHTLVRAIEAFRDMERSYPLHLLLVIIYDDYIRLRDNLSAYMNASSQLYLKAFNAQDANNR